MKFSFASIIWVQVFLLQKRKLEYFQIEEKTDKGDENSINADDQNSAKPQEFNSVLHIGATEFYRLVSLHSLVCHLCEKSRSCPLTG